jgi:hypothetical protein
MAAPDISGQHGHKARLFFDSFCQGVPEKAARVVLSARLVVIPQGFLVILFNPFAGFIHERNTETVYGVVFIASLLPL